MNTRTNLNGVPPRQRLTVPRQARARPVLVHPIHPDLFHHEPMLEKAERETLPRVAVHLNFATLDPSTAMLNDAERDALLAIVRAQSNIDFRAVEEAVNSLKLGTASAGVPSSKIGGALAGMGPHSSQLLFYLTYIRFGPRPMDRYNRKSSSSL